MGLLYGFDHMVTDIFDYVVMGFGSNSCFVTDAPYLNRGHNYEFASSVSHPILDLVRLLVYDDMRIISGASVLYYRPSG
jgi:hypothetical protein